MRWSNPDGSPCYARLIAHGRDGIYWREADPEEVPAKSGRPGGHSVDDILAVLDGKELGAEEWQKLAESEGGISRRSFYRLKGVAAKSGRVAKSKVSGLWGAAK